VFSGYRDRLSGVFFVAFFQLRRFIGWRYGAAAMAARFSSLMWASAAITRDAYNFVVFIDGRRAAVQGMAASQQSQARFSICRGV
jgi:hypothetical protein